MIVAINPEVVHDYSLALDDGEQKTIFKLGVIDSFTRAYIDDKYSIRKTIDGKVDLEDVNVHAKYLEFVRFGLRGWVNFKDGLGQDIPFETVEVNLPNIGKRTVASDSSLKRLTLGWIVELGVEILSHNQISQEELKN